MLTGKNGILKRAVEAKEKSESAQQKEKTNLKEYENDMERYVAGIPFNEETKPYLPSSNFKYKEGDLDAGLVIQDNTGNEYVWIEVPKTEKVYQTAKLGITNFTEDDYTKIENDLHNYTEIYRKGAKWTDTFYDATNDENEANKADWFQNEEEYNTLKQKMLKSIYENGGFWLGRYEAGIEDEKDIRKDYSDIVTLIPVIKKNVYSYTYVTRTQAKKLAEQVESGSCTSSLMFGVQWDLVLKFIEEKTVAKTEDANKELARTKIINDLNSDSTQIGNYQNNHWNITNVLAKYSENNGGNYATGIKQKKMDSDILLSTAASEEFKLMNIYDLAGNVIEWTLEKTSFSEYPCARRGGFYNNPGSTYPASARSTYYTNFSYYDTGFRISIIK